MRAAALQRTFANAIGYCVTCVLPADLFSDESTHAEDSSSLRADANRGGLSYIQVKGALEEGLYLARVAASPEGAATGFTVLLSEEQLYHALPWDQRLSCSLADEQHTQPERVLKMLRAHAAEVCPLVKVAPQDAGVVTIPVAPMAFEAQHVQTVEISVEELQEALGLSPLDTAQDTALYVGQKHTYHMQQAFLRAAIDHLMTQLYQGQERAYALMLKTKCALVARMQRWHRQTRQQMVNATLAFDAHSQRMSWNLFIGVPLAAQLPA